MRKGGIFSKLSPQRLWHLPRGWRHHGPSFLCHLCGPGAEQGTASPPPSAGEGDPLPAPGHSQNSQSSSPGCCTCVLLQEAGTQGLSSSPSLLLEYSCRTGWPRAVFCLALMKFCRNLIQGLSCCWPCSWMEPRLGGNLPENIPHPCCQISIIPAGKYPSPGLQAASLLLIIPVNFLG